MKNPLSKWLSDEKFEILNKNSDAYKNIPLMMLFEQVSLRFRTVEDAGKQDEVVNVEMARAVFQVLKTVVEKWPDIDEPSQYYLRGALGYFIDDDDEVGDFETYTGFIDDLEVVNACLHRAGLEDLVIDPFDYEADDEAPPE